MSEQPPVDGQLPRLQGMVQYLAQHAVKPKAEMGARTWELNPVVPYKRADGVVVRLGLRYAEVGNDVTAELLVDNVLVESALTIKNGQLTSSFGEPLGFGSGETYDLIGAIEPMLAAIRKYQVGEKQRREDARQQRLERLLMRLRTPQRWLSRHLWDIVSGVVIGAIAGAAVMGIVALVNYSPSVSFDAAHYTIDGGTVSADGETVHPVYSQQLAESEVLENVPRRSVTVAGGLREVSLAFRRDTGRCSTIPIEGDVPADTKLVSWTDVRADGVVDPSQDFTIRLQRSTREVVACFTGDIAKYEKLDTSKRRDPRIVFDLVSASATSKTP